MKMLMNKLQEIEGLSLTEMANGFFICRLSSEEDSLAPEPVFLKVLGEEIQIFRDSAHAQKSLFEKVLDGDLGSPDDSFSIKELQKLEPEELYQKIEGGE